MTSADPDVPVALAARLHDAAGEAPQDLGANISELRSRGRRRHRTRSGLAAALSAVALGAVATGGVVVADGPGRDGAVTAAGAPAPSPRPSGTSRPRDVLVSGTYPTIPVGGRALRLEVLGAGATDPPGGHPFVAIGGRTTAVLGHDTDEHGRAGALAPGFHTTYDLAGSPDDTYAYLLVGYVVGDVARIALTVDGRQQDALLTSATVDGRTVSVWAAAGPVLPARRSDHALVSSLVAYDSAGRVVARGPVGRGLGDRVSPTGSVRQGQRSPANEPAGQGAPR